MTLNAGLDAIRARSAARLSAQPFVPGDPTADDDIKALIDALQRAEADAEELKARFDDLHTSCELWARLYHANVLRANIAEAERDRVIAAGASGGEVIVERINAMRHALETLIRTCDVCRRGRLPGPNDSVCGRCELALEALEPSAVRQAR
jgi:hypothetical protein